MKKVSIIGAGLVGSLLSVFLSKRGYKVTIYERRPDMRKTNISAGRSINLALSDRGWKALTIAGIDSYVRDVAIPMNGRMIHNEKGELGYQPYGKEGQAIYSVSRGGLNSVLMDVAEKYGAEIRFDERCMGVDPEKGVVQLKNNITGSETEVESDHIFAADGAFSAARLELQMRDRFNYSQDYLEHGYKELTIPSVNGTWALEKNALHIWPRRRFMLIALPNMDGSFTCTLFFPFEGEDSFSSIRSEQEVESFFRKVFPDAVPLMPTLVKDYMNNPASSLVTVRCFPWSSRDKLLLIGDAAHAIVPFFGQGMNCGFEDCTVLHGLLDEHGEDMSRIFPLFEKMRKPNTDAIAELARQNFIEMRDLVADPRFLLRKKIEANFNSKYPEKWTPLYSMVTFSHVDYARALEEGKKQDSVMKKVMQMDDIENRWNSPEVEEYIHALISKYEEK
jgi:kynurenine 3-monooxygenase